MDQRLLSWLTVLVGLVLIVTPWIFRFSADRTAVLDITIGGIVVALLGLALTSVRPTPERHPSH